jgi:hypothetical protein
MPKVRYARIAITLPPDLVRSADREAKRVSRSRSWVIAEALRRMLAGGGAAADPAAEPEPVAARPGAVQEVVASPYADMEPEMVEVAERRLRAALALSPTERLRRAEELQRIARAVRPPTGRVQVVGFDSFEDFWRWKTAQQVAGSVRG